MIWGDLRKHDWSHNARATVSGALTILEYYSAQELSFFFFFLSFMGGETQLNQIRSKKLSQTVARLLKSVGESLRLSTIPRDRIQNGKIPMYKSWADFLCQN